MTAAHEHGRKDARVPPASASPQPKRGEAGAAKPAKADAIRSTEPPRSPQVAPKISDGKVPPVADALRELDAAAAALERAQRGNRDAVFQFLSHCMAVRRNADRTPEKRKRLKKALSERGLRARSSDRSEFTLIVKYAEQQCNLSSALRSIYVATLEHAHAQKIEAEGIPKFIIAQGGVNKCAAAHRASRRGVAAAEPDDAVARARTAAKEKPSIRMPTVPPSESAEFVALLLKRDRKQAGHWKPIAHKPADERMIRALLPPGRKRQPGARVG